MENKAGQSGLGGRLSGQRLGRRDGLVLMSFLGPVVVGDCRGAVVLYNHTCMYIVCRY